MTAIARNHRILALALLSAIASFSAQAQTTATAPANGTSPTAAPAAVGAAAAQAAAENIEACTAKTTGLLDALDKGDYATAENDFNDQMRASLGPEQLKQGWESISQKFGQPNKRGAPQSNINGVYTVVNVPMQYQSTNITVQVVCGTDGKIVGFNAKASASVPASAGS
ncbi:MAG: DUF3887 domain-containing protein [Pseudomonadota bacterium]|nr:DUF3887 domain-containing protein [Pseudomonadota bacterium]